MVASPVSEKTHFNVALCCYVIAGTSLISSELIKNKIKQNSERFLETGVILH